MKRFLSLAASMIVMLLAASCVKEQIGQEPSGEATMTLNVSLPDNAVTKAYGDGQYAAKNVIIGVFDENGVEKFRKNYVWEPDVFKKELSITFVMGKKYQMVLWAQYGEAYGDPAKMPLDKISLDYKASNREDLDAFYAYVPTFEVKEDFTKSITLTRPFAQLNFATTVGDMDESIAAGDLGIHNKAAVTIANIANTLNLLTGKTSYVAADGTETAAGAAVIIPETEFPKVDGKYPTIVVEETTYEVISMNYVLVADEGAVDGKTTVDLKLKVGELEIEVPQANMKRNWRTNVIGELLTGEGTFTVTIDPIFDGAYNENWNDGTSDEETNVKASEWKLLGSHNEWKSDEYMALEDGLAVAKNVVFPATKAAGEHQFKLFKSVAGENGATVDTWVGMSVEAVVPADKYVAAVVGDAGKDVNIAAGTYDIWYDEANKKIYVMTPEKAVKEATEFVAETPDTPAPAEETWGIVGAMTGWEANADIEMAKTTVGGVEYWFADNFTIEAEQGFKFRLVDEWANATNGLNDDNIFGGAGAVVADQAVAVAHPGADIILAAGTYDVYLDVAGAKAYFMTGDKTPADVVAPETTEVEVYVVKAADWTNNYLYAWDENNVTLAGIWPGTAAEAETVTINSVEYYRWTLTVPVTAVGQNAFVIFNNGEATAVQTVDSPAFVLAEEQYFKTGALKTLEDGKQQYEIEKIDTPVEDTPEQPEQPEQPEGFQAGKYWIVADGKYAMPLTSGFGYLKNPDTDGYTDNAFTFTAVEGGFTIQDAEGYYYYQTGTYNSFNRDLECPTEGAVWTVEENTDGSHKITNVTMSKFIQFDNDYGSYGCYAEMAANGVVPTLVDASKATARPEEPETPVVPSTGTYASNVEWELGDKAFSEKATINGEADIPVLKLGTSSVVGSASFNIPAGTTKIGFYGVAWSGKKGTLSVTIGASEVFNSDLKSNTGASNNSPYTITVTDEDHYEITLDSATTEITKVNLSTVASATRVIIFGIKAE